VKTNSIDVVDTDFGVIKLSGKTLSYLDSISPEWRGVLLKKPRKNEGKRARYLRARIDDVINACQTVAAIEFASGGILEIF
jgi:hypothetical protein